MRLVTDFSDYYDRAFDGCGGTVTRLSVGAGPDKIRHLPSFAAVTAIEDFYRERTT